MHQEPAYASSTPRVKASLGHKLPGPLFEATHFVVGICCLPAPPRRRGLIVKRWAQLAGLEGDYGARSLWSGFVTESGRP